MKTSKESKPRRARRLVWAFASAAILTGVLALPAIAITGDANDPYLSTLTTSTGVLYDGVDYGFNSGAGDNYTLYLNTSNDEIPYATSSLTFYVTRGNVGQTVRYAVDYTCDSPARTCSDVGTTTVSGSSFTITLRGHISDSADDRITFTVIAADTVTTDTFTVDVVRDNPSDVTSISTQSCSYEDYSMSAGERAACSTDLALAGWDTGVAPDGSAELVVDNSTEGIVFTVTPTGPGATMAYRWNSSGSYLGLGSGSPTPTLELSRTSTSLNVLQVRVYAQSYNEDNTDYTDYWVEIQRLTSTSDSRVSNIAYREGSSSATGNLSPSFSSTTLNYTGTTLITGSTFQLWVDSTGSQTVTAYVNGSGPTTIPDSSWTTLSGLPTGCNQVKIDVVGLTTTTTYTVALSRGTVACGPYLTALSVSAANLTTGFSPTSFTYSTVATTSSTTTVTATTTTFNATVYYSINNGTTYSSLGTGGGTTPSLTLNPGANVVLIKVTSPTNTSGNVYTLTINRTTPNNANLANLAVSTGTLVPVFSTTTTLYKVSVGEGVSSITVTPTLADTAAKVEVRVNGGAWYAVISGSASIPLALAKGLNLVEVRVTAADTTTTKTYSITAIRGPKVHIPNVIGKRLRLAKQMLRAAGFQWTVTYVHNATVPANYVVNYWPKLNRYPGWTIKLRVSKGPR